MRTERFYKMQEVTTRTDEQGDPILEGLFAVYDSVYHVYDGATESIARGAFTESINGDVRALYNHNDDLVLGRVSAGTLELRDTDAGLWGKIRINKDDQAAMDAYARISRGDVTGCSFGFEIEDESVAVRDDGTVHWTITKVNPLWEVSPCVFPAYEATHISARGKDLETIRARQLKAAKEKALRSLKGEINGTEESDASETD